MSSKALTRAGAPLPSSRCPSQLPPPQIWLRELRLCTVLLSGMLTRLGMPRTCPQERVFSGKSKFLQALWPTQRLHNGGRQDTGSRLGSCPPSAPHFPYMTPQVLAPC